MKRTFTTIGQVPSKANSYKVITLNGHGSLAKTKALKEYEMSFFMQCPFRNINIDGFFKIEVDVYYKTLMPDLDNALKILLDCLQTCKVIKNDNRCVEIHARKFKDANNPRCTISIEEIEL